MINLIDVAQPVVWPLAGYGGQLSIDAGAIELRQLPSRPTMVVLESDAMNFSGVTAREPIVKHSEDSGLYVLGFEDALPSGEAITMPRLRA